tara:strand:+ start:775 stop:1338 length:564 start_codon:yes stop_codon:yes gene_type:complete
MSHKNELPQEQVSKEIAEQVLTDKITRLTTEMTPERDLWSGIEHAISQKSQQSIDSKPKINVIPMAWAASFVVAILVSWLSFMPNSQQQSPVEVANNTQESGQLVSFMQDNFKQQKAAILVSFGQSNPAQLPQAMQKELDQLAAARKSIRQALLKDENNVDLLNLLDFTQQQELKLVTQLYRQYQVI